MTISYRQFARLLQATALCLLTHSAFTNATFAQSFRTVAEVGDRIITSYEVNQRMRFLELQNVQGDLQDRALQELINERLQQIAAKKAGIKVSPQELIAAIEEIAARTDRSAEEFLLDLASDGVDPDHFRESTATNLAWRNYIRAKFGPIASANDAEIDRELGLSSGRGSLEIRFAEIFLPTNTPNNLAITQDLAPQIAALSNFAEFSDAARRFSVGGTRANGGVVEGWTPVTNLPPQLRGELSKMRPGQVTDPIEFDGAVGLFQLRGIREARARANTTAIDFMTYRVGPGNGRNAQQNADRALDQIDTCNDLYGIAKRAPSERLVRQTTPVSAIPRNFAGLLETLDAGESGTVPAPDGDLYVVTLCARVSSAATTEDGAADVNRAEIANAITNRKLTAYSEALIQELRGETRINLR